MPFERSGRVGLGRRAAGVVLALMLSAFAAEAPRAAPAEVLAAVAVAAAPAATEAVAGPAAAAATEAVLQVSVDGAPAQAFTVQRLSALPRQEVEVTVRGGAVERWTGVALTDLLRAAGLDLSANLGGGFVSRRVLAARARDGYVAAFGLAEIDPRFGRRVPIVAWHAPDGSPLAAHRGPLILVSPEDARASRGVRQLQSISVNPIP